MKSLAFLLLVITFIVFADSSQPGYLGQPFVPAGPSVDDFLCSQPFQYSSLQNGLGCNSSNNWRIADDVVFSVQSEIGRVHLWMIFTGATASQFNFALFEDAGSGPGSIPIWSNGETYITNTDTGLSNWGYTLWYSTTDLSSQVGVPVAAKYWFSVQTESSSSDYWLCTDQKWADETYFSQDNGATWASSTSSWGSPYEQFMILETVMALDHSTWGEIKAVF